MPAETSAPLQLEFPDPSYFEFDQATKRKLVDQFVVRTTFQGTVIGLPQAVELTERQTLPLIWVTRQSGRRSWQVQLQRNSWLVYADLTRDQIRVGRALAGAKPLAFGQLPRSGEGEPPPPEVADGAGLLVTPLDVRATLNLPWEAGRVATTLLVYDWVSATRVTELTRQGRGLNAKELEALQIPAARAQAVAQALRETAGTPTPRLRVGPFDGAPPLEGWGAALVVPPRVGLADPRWLVTGRLRVPVAAGSLVAQPTDAPGEAPPPPAALLHPLLLLLRLDAPAPYPVALELPVEAPAPLQPGAPVEATFQLDLKQAFPDAPAPTAGAYLVYLFAGEQVGGPWPCELVP